MSAENQAAAGPSRLEDLQPGMVVAGKVVKIADFGAFVDIGVGQDGLIHISELSDDYVRRVEEVVKIGEEVEVTILDVDPRRRRISLSMKAVPAAPVVQEDEEPLPTVMELAFRRAFGQVEEEEKPKKRRKKKRSGQSDIVARTLQLRENQ